MKETTILGIDPGYDRCGWAVLASSGRSQQRVIAFDTIVTNRAKEKLARIHALWQNMDQIIREHQVQEVAIESLFFSRNVSTALPVSEVRGALFALCFSHQLTLTEYTPNQVKSAVTGYGRADKGMVGTMVKRLLRLEKIPNLDDTGDALAVALTHAVCRQSALKNL